MQSKYYGQISLTKLGEIAKKHTELVKEVTFKDGHKEKFINISILADEEPNQYGKIGTVRADCKMSEQKKDLNYFVGDLRPSTPKASNDDWDKPVPPLGKQEEDDDLPF